MKLLALWVDPASPNLGVQALAEGLSASLPADWEVEFASHALPLGGTPLSLKNWLRASVGLHRDLIPKLRTFDAAVDIGEGDSFASIYGWKRFMQLASSKVAVSRFIPVSVIGPQTLGPWETAWTRRVANVALNGNSQIWARDSESAERASDIGVKARLASDLVFAVPQPTILSGGTPSVLVNVSGLLWNENSHVDSTAYKHIVRNLLGDLAERKKSVGLIAHVISPGSPDDDVHVTRQLSDEYPNTRAYYPANLSEARQIIGSADLLVGSRMHACLNAISVGVAALPLAYSSKFAPLLGDLNYSHGADLRQVPDGWTVPMELLDRIPEMTRDARRAQMRGRQRVDTFAAALRGIEATTHEA